MHIDDFYSGQEVILHDPESYPIADPTVCIVRKVSRDRSKVFVKTHNGSLSNWACPVRDGVVYSGQHDSARAVTGFESNDTCDSDDCDERPARTAAPARPARMSRMTQPAPAPVRAASKLLEEYELQQMSEPQRSFFEAGVTNADGFLTSEGTVVFLQWLLEDAGEEFCAGVISKILKKDEKAAKKRGRPARS